MMRFSVPVHGVIENAPRIGKIVANNQPLCRQQGNSDPRSAIICVVEHPDVPRTRLIARRKTRCEGVEGEDQLRLCALQPLFQRSVIGTVETSNARFPICADIARDWMPIARLGREAGSGFLAVEIAHETADGRDMRGDCVFAGKDFRDRRGADVDRDVFMQQVFGDAEVNVIGQAVRGMIGDTNNAPDAGRSDLAVGFAHRNRPAIVHHAPGIAAAATSRASGVS